MFYSSMLWTCSDKLIGLPVHGEKPLRGIFSGILAAHAALLLKSIELFSAMLQILLNIFRYTPGCVHVLHIVAIMSHGRQI